VITISRRCNRFPNNKIYRHYEKHWNNRKNHGNKPWRRIINTRILLGVTCYRILRVFRIIVYDNLIPDFYTCKARVAASCSTGSGVFNTSNTISVPQKCMIFGLFCCYDTIRRNSSICESIELPWTKDSKPDCQTNRDKSKPYHKKNKDWFHGFFLEHLKAIDRQATYFLIAAFMNSTSYGLHHIRVPACISP